MMKPSLFTEMSVSRCLIEDLDIFSQSSLCELVCLYALANRWIQHDEAAAMISTISLVQHLRPRCLVVENVMGWAQTQPGQGKSAKDFFQHELETKHNYKGILLEVDHGWWLVYVHSQKDHDASKPGTLEERLRRVASTCASLVWLLALGLLVGVSGFVKASVV